MILMLVFLTGRKLKTEREAGGPFDACEVPLQGLYYVQKINEGISTASQCFFSLQPATHHSFSVLRGEEDDLEGPTQHLQSDGLLDREKKKQRSSQERAGNRPRHTRTTRRDQQHQEHRDMRRENQSGPFVSPALHFGCQSYIYSSRRAAGAASRQCKSLD